MYTFDNFWNDYQKKVDPAGCKKLWNKLKPKEIANIQNNAMLYVKSKPDKQFRKDPIRYLRHRAWEDEIIEISTPEINLEQKLGLPPAKLALQRAFRGCWDKYNANWAAFHRLDTYALSRMRAEYAENAFGRVYKDVLMEIDSGKTFEPQKAVTVTQVAPESPTERFRREQAER